MAQVALNPARASSTERHVHRRRKSRWPRHLPAVRLFLSALVIGCALSPGCTSRPLDAVERERWARAWIGAINSRSVEQVEPLLRSAAGYTSPLAPRVLGPNAAVGHIAGFWRRFPQGRVELKAVHGNRHDIVVEWLAYPQGQGEAIPGATVLTLDRGEICWVENAYNAALLLKYFYPQKPAGERTGERAPVKTG